MTISRTTKLAALTVLFALAAAPAEAQSSKQAGTLLCNLGPSVGLIIGSRQRMTCVFTNSATGRRENYVGRIGRLGLDIGIQAGGRMVWGVIARTDKLGPRALVGDYVGASGEIGLGLGVGANALVGGSNRTVALQPLSVEASVGVNLALGVARLALR
jgi:Protein of unknown function (DUF992)